jgi:ADP-ribose pyrophosphatase
VQKVIPPGARLIPDEAERVFEGVIFDVYQWQQELFDGSFRTFEYLKRADTVMILAVVDDKLVITFDEQPGRGPLYTEPGGRVDSADDSTLAAAQRELKEETGYSFEKWKLVDVVAAGGKMEYFCYTYVAYGSYEQSQPELDPGEKIEVYVKDFTEVKSLIERGDAPRLKMQRVLTDTSSVAELLAYPEFRGQVVDRTPKHERYLSTPGGSTTIET